jgi:hypothetical protein
MARSARDFLVRIAAFFAAPGAPPSRPIRYRRRIAVLEKRRLARELLRTLSPTALATTGHLRPTARLQARMAFGRLRAYR